MKTAFDVTCLLLTADDNLQVYIYYTNHVPSNVTPALAASVYSASHKLYLCTSFCSQVVSQVEFVGGCRRFSSLGQTRPSFEQ